MIMTHSVNEVIAKAFKKSLLKHHIFMKFRKIEQNNTEFLSFSNAILNYNVNMRKCDENAQQRTNSSSKFIFCRY